MWVVGLYFLLIQSGGSPWRTGDWLINYQAGFVRRGLIGELLYIISPYGWLLMSVFFVQSLIYITICHFVIEEFFSKKRGIVDALVIFSPAFIFFFSFYTPAAGMRKELLAFLSFVLLLEATKKNKSNLLLLLSFIVFFVGVFSHEMIGLFVVFYVYAIFKRLDSTFAFNAFYAFILVVISLSGIFLSATFQGGLLTAKSICDSLILKDIGCDICRGAIPALSGTRLSSVLLVGSKFPVYLVYLPLFVFSFIPMVFIGWRKYLPIVVLGFVSILPLFFVAIDWGRWIYVYMTFLFLFYVYDDGCVAKRGVKKPLLVFFAFYLLAWRLPHFAPDLLPAWGAFMIPYNIWKVFSDIALYVL